MASGCENAFPVVLLPGRDFLSITSDGLQNWLEGRTRRSAWLCSLSFLETALTTTLFLVCLFFLPKMPRLSRTLWVWHHRPPEGLPLPLFLRLRPQRPVAMTTAPRDSVVWKLAGLLRESGEWTSGCAGLQARRGASYLIETRQKSHRVRAV